MSGDAEFMTGDPRWHNFPPGTSPLDLFFAGVEASRALSWDVLITLDIQISSRKHLRKYSKLPYVKITTFVNLMTKSSKSLLTR